MLARLRKQPHKPPLLSIFLTNARTLANKMDELRLLVATNNIVKNSCILLVTETWLNSSIPDMAIELERRTVYRHDRTTDSGKNRGGGLCIYLDNKWVTNTKVVSSHCSPDLEYVTVKCRPIYLAREHTAVMLTAVYIAPDANASSTIGYLHDTISNQQSMYHEAVHIIAGDFNHANLKAVLPKFHQHVKYTNTLDKVYSNIRLGFRAKPLPHLGLSYHMSVHLIPAYTPLRKRAPTITKNFKNLA